MKLLKKNSNEIIENKIYQTKLKTKFIKQNSNKIENKIQMKFKQISHEIIETKFK
jgi:hypothetical protein